MIAVAAQLRHCRDTMSHDDAAAIIDALQRAQAALYEHGDPNPVREMLTGDVEWVVPGASPIAGSYRGVDETVAYMLARRELAAGGTARRRPVPGASRRPRAAAELTNHDTNAGSGAWT